MCLLDLYTYTTIKYPNVKQLSWAINYCLSRGSICPKTLSSRSLLVVRLSHRPSQLALHRVEWQVISFLGVALKAAMVIDRDVIANGDKYNGSAS